MTDQPTNRLPAASPPPSAKPLPMMGRDDALQKLRDRLHTTREGSGGRLAIMGESGLGKTRLVREIADEAQRDGMLVGMIEYRGSKLRPYEPMADLVRSLLGIDPTSRRDAQRMPLAQGLDAMGYGKFEPAFARLLRIEGSGPAPSAAALADAASLRPPSTIDGPIDEFDFDGTVHDMQVKLELGDMLSLMLQGLANQGQSILLILEDLDEAAELARTVAMRLMEDIEHLPILILVTYSPAASRDLHAGFRGSVIALRPLTKEQATEIGAAAMDITWLTKEMADAVWEATGGNPLLITLLMQHLAESERLRIRPGDRLGELVGDDPVPSGHDLIVARIRTLPPMLLKTMLNAVVLGDGFRVGALGALYESRSEDDLRADLDSLIERGFMESSGSGRNAVYRFSHGIVRDTLYETAPPDKRAQMHHRAADYYSIPMPGRKPRTESIIYHYARAGEIDQALAVIDRSLKKAQTDGSREQVIALYQESLNIMHEVPELTEQRNIIAETLGDIHAAAYEYPQAALAYQHAELSDASPILHAKVGLAMLAVDPSQAIMLMQRTAPSIPLEYADDLRWRLEAGQAWGLALLGRTYDAVRKTRDALGTLSSSTGFGSARTMMRGALGMALYYHGDQAEASPHLESARAGYGARGDDDGVLFINQVLIGMPREEITQLWLNLMLKPLVRPAE